MKDATDWDQRALLASMREGVITYELLRGPRGEVLDAIIRDANAAALRALARPPSEVIGRTAIELFGREPVEPFRAVAEGVVRSGEPQSLAARWKGSRLHATVFRVAEALVGVVSLNVPSSAARRRCRSGFVAMLAHELRNPLGPVGNALWLMDRTAPGSEQARQAKQVISRQFLHLTRIVDDLLDVTRISRGRIRLQRTRVELVELVRRTLDDHGTLFSPRGVSLGVHLEAPPVWIDADATRIAQVLANLLWNAAKFTDPGGHVEVAIEREEGSVAVRIRDDGIGIPPGVLEHVFEPFTQADTSLDRTRGGLGLGLSLVKGVVELHGGSVEVRSEGPGRGAEFAFRLPVASEAPVSCAPARPAQERMPHHRVLVVEDNFDAAETLRDMLLMWNQEVEVAHDGLEGVEKARTFRPDVVLCDIGLPVMDGYAVARAIRADPALASAFLVAITGYTSPEDERRAVDAGFDRHLGKPAPIELVEEVLATAPCTGAAQR